MTLICHDLLGCDDLSLDCQISTYASEKNVSGVLGRDFQIAIVVDVSHWTRYDYGEQLEAIDGEGLETGMSHDVCPAFVHGFQTATFDPGRTGGCQN